jgi:hypothetical protein
MKKILKFHLPAFITLFSLLILVFGYLLANHSVLLRYPLGKAIAISTPVDAVVKINGVEQPESTVFSMNEGEKLLVYSPNTKETYPVIIVDKLKNNIGYTNSGEENYELLFDRFLFQSENAYDIIYASSMKWEHNPKLQISDQRIFYVTEKYENGNDIEVNVEVIFKGEK